MLVRGGMDHDIRLEFLHDTANALIVAYRCDYGGKVKVGAVFERQFLLDIIGVVFVNIHNDELFGGIGGNLTAKLRAY